MWCILLSSLSVCKISVKIMMYVRNIQTYCILCGWIKGADSAVYLLIILTIERYTYYREV